MELLQSLITTNTPSLLNFFKYWLIKILQTAIDVLLMYPINLLIFTSAIFLVAYKVSCKLFGKK
jgi:hypothetical protein